MNVVEESALEVLIEKLFPIYFDQVITKKITPNMMITGIKKDVYQSFPGIAGRKNFDIKIMETIIKICQDKNEGGDKNAKIANSHT